MVLQRVGDGHVHSHTETHTHCGVAKSWGGGHTWRVCSRQPIRLRGSGMAEVEMDKELDLGSDLLKTHTHTRHTHQTPPSPRLRGSGMVEEEMDKELDLAW